MSTPEAQTNYLDVETIEVNNYQDWETLKQDRDKFKVLGWYFSFYTGIGVLIQEELIDVRLVAKMMSGNIAWFWNEYRDGIYRMRVQQNWPRWGIMLEYLYDQVVEYGEKYPELEIATPEKI